MVLLASPDSRAALLSPVFSGGSPHPVESNPIQPNRTRFVVYSTTGEMGNTDSMVHNQTPPFGPEKIWKELPFLTADEEWAYEIRCAKDHHFVHRRGSCARRIGPNLGA